jgi:hypothetical protein
MVPILPSTAADNNQDLLKKYAWPPAPTLLGNTLDDPLLGYQYGIVDDFTQGAEAHSFISVGGPVQPLCSGFQDPVCLTEISRGNGWWLNAVLPPCDLARTIDACIEGVKVTDGTGSRELVFNKILSGPTWAADATHGDVPGSSPSLWRDPADSDSSHGFKVTVSGNLATQNPSSTPIHTNLASFQSSVAAYQEVQGNYQGYELLTNAGVSHPFWGSGPGCIWSEQGVCGAMINFPLGMKIQLRVHIPSELSSWLIGRISNPTIALSDISGAPQSKRLSIEADPVNVPLFHVEVPIAKASEKLKNGFNSDKNTLCNPSYPSCQHGFIGGNTSASYPTAFEGYDLFQEYLDQKAGIMMPTWSVRTVQNSLGSTFNSCPKFGFSGLVTTNASIYEGNPPTWDGSSLNYKVAGVHLDPDGNVFQGSYDLILKSELARCLYKLSNTPISATISVVDSGGSQIISTATFKEENGWVRMSARGFTFSSPTVKVKLNQEAPSATPSHTPTASPNFTPTVVPTPSATPALPTVKKLTITCIKGKVLKSVTGIKPVCPVGYKKK